MKIKTKKKILLIEEAIEDWRKGKLSDLAVLTAIGIIINNSQLSNEAIKWGIDVLKENGEK